MEFKAFPKIERFGKAQMQITQKIHGTNAQVFIIDLGEVPSEFEAGVQESADKTGALIVDGRLYRLYCGSRTRWIYPGDDNYGFAAFVHSHKEEFIRKLGPGQHFGEWAGLGINSGEGLTEKRFVLFDFWKYPPERELPPGCMVIPVLYQGPVDLTKITAHMEDLKKNGSRLVPGFMRPEGVVVTLFGTRYKMVFDAEETQWKKGDENAKKQKQEQENVAQTQYGHLFQPIRLEKLVSRDERYTREFPKNLPQIAEAYWNDLVAEGQVTGSEGELKGIRKLISSELFKFIRIYMLNGMDALGGLNAP